MHTNQTWQVVSVTVSPEAAEAVEFAFNEIDPDCGTEINNLRKDQRDDVVVKGYFDREPDDARLNDALREAFRIYGFTGNMIRGVERSVLGNEDWLHEWKKHWKPTGAGRFIITPPWETVEDPDKIVIEIEPAMAFGTGTHDTTRLCLEAIGERYKTGQTFLDVGTGTGILSIAAAKLGATAISACDTDADSIENARLNAEMNGVQADIDFSVSSISKETPVFDFVCANLTLDVIVPLLDLLLEKSGQILILSGILGEQEDEIISALADRGITEARVSCSGEWISVLVEH